MIRFSQINRFNSAGHKPNYQRHHIIPRQAASESDLRQIFQNLEDDGFSLEDFRKNGILLPCCEKEALRTGQPLHRGPHPRYNEIVIERLFLILKLGDCLDDVVKRQEFIRFRFVLLQSSLHTGLISRQFDSLYLSARDPLRTGVKFDQMDSRIDRMYRNARSDTSAHACFTFGDRSFRNYYISEL